MNRASINLVNGLGDKLLDLIGFYVLCKYMNYCPYIYFSNNGNFAWGTNNYDLRLFNFQNIQITNTFPSSSSCDYHVNSPNPSSSLSPYKVYVFLKQFIPDISFEQISNDFVTCSKQIIQPSEIITSKIPNNIQNAYGIHLRKSDKLRTDGGGDIRHENTGSEFEIITNKLLDDVTCIITSEDEPAFVIVSEDEQWKLEISNIILDIAKNKNRSVQILQIDYTNEHNCCNLKSVLDMFCLSRCKEVLQGVKYSTFSILASLLGNGKLRNYSNHTSTYDSCLIHSWSSVIYLNNKKCFDLVVHENVTSRVYNLIIDDFKG